jgi:hypothetical protein
MWMRGGWNWFRLYAFAGFGISDVEPFGFAIRELVN